MARPVYSVPLLEGTITGEGEISADLLGPDTWVVRQIQIVGFTSLSTAVTLTVSIGGIVFWADAVPVAWAGTLSWEGRRIAPGPTMLTVAAAGDAGTWAVSVDGYQLTP
jgi:hypothetical protein